VIAFVLHSDNNYIMQEVATLEKFLYVDVISTEMSVFNAMGVFNTIEVSFPDITPVLKTFEKGDWRRQKELKHLRRRVRERDSPFRKARALLTLRQGKFLGELSGPQEGRVLWSVSPAAYDGRWT